MDLNQEVDQEQNQNLDQSLWLLQQEILLRPSRARIDQVSSRSDAPLPLIQTQTLLLCNYGRRAVLFFPLFFPLKEVSFLVFPKREQQQRWRGNEGASPQPVQAPVPPSSSGSHIKALVENECRQ